MGKRLVAALGPPPGASRASEGLAGAAPGFPGPSPLRPGGLSLPLRAGAETTLLEMLPALAAGLHLGGGVHIPGIAAVTEESVAEVGPCRKGK